MVCSFDWTLKWGKDLKISVLEPDVLSMVQNALYLTGNYPILCYRILADAEFQYDGVRSKFLVHLRWTSERDVIQIGILYDLLETLLCKAI